MVDAFRQLNIGHFYSRHCVLLLLYFSLINECSSQISTPLTTFTVTSSGNMTSASGLIPGYDAVNHGIWLIDGGGREVYYFDIETQTFIDDSNNYLSFSTAPNIYGQAYTQIDNLLYFAFNEKLQVFDLTAGQIINAINFTPNLTSVAGPCLANDGRFIFLVSGTDESEFNSPPINKFTIYDTVGNSWTQGQSIQTAVRQSACNIINNYLYLYGGSDFSGIAVRKVPRVYIGNMAAIATANWNNNWETMQGNWYNHRTVVVGDMIYVIGGKVIGENPDKSIQIMDSAGNMQLSTVLINSGRSAPGVIAVNNIIYVFGGADTGVIYDTWEYSNVIAVTTKPPTLATINPTTNNPTTSVPTTSVPTTSVPTTSMHTTSMHTTSMHTTSMHTTSMHTTSMHTTSMHTTSMPTTSIVPSTQSKVPTKSPTNLPTKSATYTEQQQRETTMFPTSNDYESNINANQKGISSGLYIAVIIFFVCFIFGAAALFSYKFWRKKQTNNSMNIKDIVSSMSNIEITNVKSSQDLDDDIEIMDNLDGVHVVATGGCFDDDIVIMDNLDGVHVVATDGCFDDFAGKQTIDNDLGEHGENDFIVWLDSIGLLRYYDIFIQNGFDSLEMIQEINNETDLHNIGITLQADRLKIINRSY